MKTKPVPYATIELVVALLIRIREEPELLLGPKLTGDMAGFMMPPGGKMKSEEDDSIAACDRETFEETRLKASKGHIVARLHNRVTAKRKKKVVHFIRYDSWEGRLRACKREFEWLKFIPFSQIPWDKFPPGEAEWMKKVILNEQRLLAVVTCGHNRLDWKRTRTYPLRA